jgi:hypothetical protein
VGAFCFSVAVAAAPPSQLEVTSTNLDATAEQASARLRNTSASKTVVAYTLRIVGLDASGKPIGNPLTVGWDLLCIVPNCPETAAQIPPGQSRIRDGLGVPAGTVSVEITAVGAIYSDRTFDGEPVNTRNIFAKRAEVAKDMRTALSWLSSSSLSPTEWQTVLSKARSLTNSAPVIGVFANNSSNPLQTFDLAMGDMKSPVSLPSSAPTPAQIAEMKAELATEAAFEQAQSQAVNQ